MKIQIVYIYYYYFFFLYIEYVYTCDTTTTCSENFSNNHTIIIFPGRRPGENSVLFQNFLGTALNDLLEVQNVILSH